MGKTLIKPVCVGEMLVIHTEFVNAIVISRQFLTLPKIKKVAFHKAQKRCEVVGEGDVK